jgi:hypothetical protein
LAEAIIRIPLFMKNVGIGLGFLIGLITTLVVIGAVETKFMAWRAGRELAQPGA